MNVQDLHEATDGHVLGNGGTTADPQGSEHVDQHLEHHHHDHGIPGAGSRGEGTETGDTSNKLEHPPKGNVATPGNHDEHQRLPRIDHEVVYETTPPRNEDRDPREFPRQRFRR